MKLPTWPAAILGSMLAAVWFANPAGAQGLDHGEHLPALPVQETAVGIAHGAAQGSAVFLTGLAAFAALVWLPANRRDAGQEKILGLFARWMWALVAGLVVAGVVELSLYAVRASGDALSPGLLREALFETRVGELWIARLVFAVLAATAATYSAWLRRPVYLWGAALFAGALMLMTLTRQSHAAAEEGFLPFATDWLHLVAASLWMGGLLGFSILLVGPLRAMPAGARAELLGRTVHRFSRVATIAVIALIVTGSYAILLHVPSLSGLAATSYGRALSIKLGLLLFLLALGAWNLRLQGREPFGNLVRVELALAIGIFVATGFLTSLPPATAA